MAFLFATDNLLLSREEDEPDASALLQAALRKYATARVGRGPGTHTHAGWTHARTHAQGPDGEIIAQRARVNAGMGVRARAGSCGLVRGRPSDRSVHVQAPAGLMPDWLHRRRGRWTRCCSQQVSKETYYVEKRDLRYGQRIPNIRCCRATHTHRGA